MKTITVSETYQLSVGIKFTFMGVDLSAYYKKTDNGYEVFLAPSNIENSVQLSIADMIKEFNQLSGGSLTEQEVQDKISSEADRVPTENGDPLTVDWSSVKFCLKMLFLNVKSVKSGEEENRTVEYAISLQIIADDLLPKDIKIFNIDSLSFNLWNTQRQSVLEHMALIDPASYD